MRWLVLASLFLSGPFGPLREQESYPHLERYRREDTGHDWESKYWEREYDRRVEEWCEMVDQFDRKTAVGPEEKNARAKMKELSERAAKATYQWEKDLLWKRREFHANRLHDILHGRVALMEDWNKKQDGLMTEMKFIIRNHDKNSPDYVPQNRKKPR